MARRLSLARRPPSPREVFIKQSVRSDYCGVYSTAMLLSLAGMRTSRRDALSLFGIAAGSRNFDGASLEAIEAVVRRSGVASSVGWLFRPEFDFPAVGQLLRKQLSATAMPTLLWFGIVHRHRPARARHIAVVTQASRGRIRLLDPLGARPRRRMSANVDLVRRGSGGERRVSADGCFYVVDRRQKVAILRWRASPGVSRRRRPLRALAGHRVTSVRRS